MLTDSSGNIEVLVYALLDTHSNISFKTDEVVSVLNVSDHQTLLDLTPMSGRVNVPTVDVVARSSVNGSYMGISSYYVWDSFPCKREIIHTDDVVGKWPHISYIDIPHIYEAAPIGLLIGYHCPQIMRPLKIDRK